MWPAKDAERAAHACLVVDRGGHHHSFLVGLLVCAHTPAMEFRQPHRWCIPHAFRRNTVLCTVSLVVRPKLPGLFALRRAKCNAPLRLDARVALAAALVVVTKGSGRWMILVLAGDAFWAHLWTFLLRAACRSSAPIRGRVTRRAVQALEGQRRTWESSVVGLRGRSSAG